MVRDEASYHFDLHLEDSLNSEREANNAANASDPSLPLFCVKVSIILNENHINNITGEILDEISTLQIMCSIEEKNEINDSI